MLISNRKIIDFHTHIFPQNLAPRAVANIGGYYGIQMQGGGTAEELASVRERLPHMRYVICSAALKQESMKAGNDFLLAQAEEHEFFIPFSSFYPYMPPKEAEAELIRTKELGAKGVKLHPDFQRYEIDHPNAVEIYKICAGLGLPVLFHLGDENTDFSTPARMYNVMRQVPMLKAVAAHMGGYMDWDDAEKILADTDVYFDTSNALYALSEERVFNLVRRYGSERVMFGSDFPFFNPEFSFCQFDKLPFDEREKENIYYLTAEKLLGL